MTRRFRIWGQKGHGPPPASAWDARSVAPRSILLPATKPDGIQPRRGPARGSGAPSHAPAVRALAKDPASTPGGTPPSLCTPSTRGCSRAIASVDKLWGVSPKNPTPQHSWRSGSSLASAGPEPSLGRPVAGCFSRRPRINAGRGRRHMQVAWHPRQGQGLLRPAVWSDGPASTPPLRLSPTGRPRS